LLGALDKREPHIVVIVTKGLVSSAGRRRYGKPTFSGYVEALAAEAGFVDLQVVTLSGPSLLAEMDAMMHTFFIIAAPNARVSAVVKSLVAGDTVHVRETQDRLGVELGGVLKNPVAIACGIADGLPHAGTNVQGILVMQGFREMTRLAVSLGAKRATLHGDAGLADLVTTCTSPNSRNRAYGQQFVKKLISHENDPGLVDRIELFLRPATYIEREVRQSDEIVEGAFALSLVLDIAQEKDLHLPLYSAIFDILSRRKPPETILNLAAGRELTFAGDESRVAHKQKGYDVAAGHSFRRVLERRIYRHVAASKGMHTRVKRQAPTILSSLERRLSKAQKTKNEHDLASIPTELQLWKNIIAGGTEREREELARLIDFYVEEISDSYNPAVRGTLIRVLGPLRFALSGFRPGSAVPNVGGRAEELADLASRYNILYAPMHRSHLDSLEVAFGLSWAGLPVPRYAAGANLMASPVWSWILKSLGAYSVDRERTRNILYLECLTRYSTMMLEVGIPSLVYPEGTRSRTGDIMPIKTGLLSTAVEAFQSTGSEILVVPLALSYASVPEDREFSGQSGSPAFMDFVRGRGDVFLDVCDPIRVSRYMDAEDPAFGIAAEIARGWRKYRRVLPNQIVSRILSESESTVTLSEARALVEEFVASRPANYEYVDTRRILEKGIAELKRRKLVSVRDGAVIVEEPALLTYYGNMASPGVEF
ncbi:MAG: 1-acyl-sn-glycerol-3-phosphate acyltransferase, partial [Spirochaetia bacterium]|nr:1-acyl-sn-glycerol-3-phosphate acyltransferase [Spirochaetia bacterium]